RRRGSRRAFRETLRPEQADSDPADEVEIPVPKDRGCRNWKGLACYAVTVLNVGSCGSVTLVSRSKPSFSSLMCSMAMALALASRSGRATYLPSHFKRNLKFL